VAFTQGDNAYCSVNDISAQLGGFTVPAAWTTSLVQDAIIRATQQIATGAGIHFGDTQLTMEVSGDGDALLNLLTFTTWPVLSITNVYYRDAYVNNYNWVNSGELVDADTYTVADHNHGLWRMTTGSSRGIAFEYIDGPIWLKGMKNYRVQGQFGYHEIPQPIIDACILLVRDMIQPGYTIQHEIAISERFPDGYSRQSRSTNAAALGETAPIFASTIVNDLVSPYVYDLPGMGFL